MVENLIPVMEVPHQKAPELESQVNIMDSSDRSFIVREVRGRIRLLAMCLSHHLEFVSHDVSCILQRRLRAASENPSWRMLCCAGFGIVLIVLIGTSIREDVDSFAQAVSNTENIF